MGRPHTAAAVLLTLAVAATASAQGRVIGVVLDTNARPIKGATIRAMHPDSTSQEWTSTTDDKGRWVMLGLRIGPNWRFIAEAPGFLPVEGTAQVRSTIGQPIRLVLRNDPGPPPGALVKDIQEQVAAADTLRDQGRYDLALAAYESIHAKNPKLTAINLVIADVYRRKAAQERDESARRTLLERADAAERAAAAASLESN
jgi:hypothetical protein